MRLHTGLLLSTENQRIKEYIKLEGTHKYHQVQLPVAKIIKSKIISPAKPRCNPLPTDGKVLSARHNLRDPETSLGNRQIFAPNQKTPELFMS